VEVLVRRLDRVAQLVVQRVERVLWRETDALPDSARGTGGYGSTGGWTTPGTAPAAAPVPPAGPQTTPPARDAGRG
jgi:dUTP pyrophosphatase